MNKIRGELNVFINYFDNTPPIPHMQVFSLTFANSISENNPGKFSCGLGSYLFCYILLFLHLQHFIKYLIITPKKTVHVLKGGQSPAVVSLQHNMLLTTSNNKLLNISNKTTRTIN